MLMVKAEAPAGLTIRDAIREALELSSRIHAMVSMEINDIPMLFSYSSFYGSTMEERIENYHKEYMIQLRERDKN